MSNLQTPIIQGYLVLADISGYTSYLAGVELDHAHEILTDLLEVIVMDFKRLLTIHKIEGDAIFGYVPDARLVRGETLLELLETTYVDFRERMKNVRRHTTCTCRACQSIPMLDLKFILHHGSFVSQSIAGTPELAGSDVNLAHRLLKNHVSENTGWRAYALITFPALQHMGIKPDNLVEGTEAYEHLGEVHVCLMDLHPRYEALMQARRVVVEDPNAMLTFGEDLPLPPPEVWSWLNDPQKRQLVSMDPHGLKFVPVYRPAGRTGVNATTHCVHGQNVAMRETVLDWKPFDYFTVQQDSGPMGIVQVTFRFQPLEESHGTRLHAALIGSLKYVPRFLNRWLIKLIYTRVFNYAAVAAKLKELMTEAASHPPAPQ